MNLNFLLSQDFHEFEVRFPEAYRFLTFTNLLREREHLYAEIAKEHPSSPYVKWQKDRLRELDLWYAEVMKPLCEPNKFVVEDLYELIKFTKGEASCEPSK